MARYTFRLPDIGEGLAGAEIVGWHVKVGDRIEEDAPLVDMMTDKATVEMESPVAGTVIELAGAVGDVVPVGAALVVLETDASVPATDMPATEPPIEPLPPFIRPRMADRPVEPPAAPTEPTPALTPPAVVAPPASRATAPSPPPATGTDTETGTEQAKVLASPAVRARAKALGINLAAVRPATNHHVRHSDLDAFLAYNAAGGYQPAGQRGQDVSLKVIGLRRRIAEAMTESKRHIPHFSYVEECDVTALEELRAQLNARLNGEGGEHPHLTLLPLFIVALCRALPQFPMMNARYDDEAGVVTRHGAIHLGLATQTPAGLMVPVLRDAQDRNLWQLAGEIARLARAARDGSATSAELSGSTITVTSLGPLGGVAHTPIVNRPEVAIIGPNRIVERPMFVADGLGGERLEKRKLMNLSISCDHRVVDGWDAAKFVQAVKRLLEAPALLLAPR